MEKFQIKTMSNGAYAISGDTTNLASERVKICVEGKEALINFDVESKKDGCIGKVKGTIFSSKSSIAGINVTREIFLSEDNQTAAVRVKVRNSSSIKFNLDSIELMRMTEQPSFVVGQSGIDKWKVLRYPFHKSDIPSYYRPTVTDKDFSDAVFSCINAVPGKGVLYNIMNIETRTITSGPVMIVKNAERSDLPIMMLAVTDIRNHYILQSLTTSEDRSEFADFNITCDFLGVNLAPGKETETHWLLITTGAHESDLLDKYAEMVADIHHIAIPSKPSPTVYCTWYFYTFLITEQYILEELKAIKDKQVPLDVFQVDDGWMDSYGTYEPHPEKFPNGMEFIAEQIREAGMTAGIWAAPFVIDSQSPIVDRYPDMFQKDKNGERIVYATDRDCYVLDPTAPGAEQYLNEIMSKLKSWGFHYFKLDWLRAIYEFPNAVLHDSNINRIEGYNLAMRMIRDALGNDVFILACGGLADPGALGLVNGSRTSKDVRGIWNGPEGVPKSGAVIQLKQNFLRSYVNRFFHGDPDATQIRIRKQRFSEQETRCVGVYQSEGHYTDEEAFTICAHQYICGGLITISERFPELQDERLALLRHISPAITNPARILDYDAPVCPTLFLTDVHPECKAIGNYRTLAIGNWEDHSITRRLALDSLPESINWDTQQAVFEFRTQRFLGIFSSCDEIIVELPPHSVRMLRITPWTGDKPVILGTDLHITGGAAEITELNIKEDALDGTVKTAWQYPVVITAAFPNENSACVRQTVVPIGGEKFEISK